MRFNAHTHLYSGLAPLGMPLPEGEPESFVDILETIWWKLDRAHDVETLRASARYYVAHALEAGCSGLIDHNETPSCIEGSLDVIADACQELGMPALLCYGATERNGGRGEAHRGLEECRRFVEANQRPLVKGAVGLHASFTVSDETIAEAAALAADLAVPLHLHVAEDRADVEDARARGYDGVVDRLESLGALIRGSIFAHGVHLDRDEVAKLDHKGIWLVQNPRSNRGNRVGYPRNLTSSRRVALGTDGYPADMEAELAALEEIAAAGGEDPAAAASRIRGSARLMGEIFGVAPERLAEGCGTVDEATLRAIDAEAEAAAATLWKRMKDL